MTRFARAKGSKASNQRVPEEATSWQEMKQGMVQTNKVESLEDESHSERTNYERNFARASFSKKVETPATWSEFPVADDSNEKLKKKKKRKQLNNDDEEPKANKKKHKAKHSKTSLEDTQTEKDNMDSCKKPNIEENQEANLSKKSFNKKKKEKKNKDAISENDKSKEDHSESTKKKKQKSHKSKNESQNNEDTQKSNKKMRKNEFNERPSKHISKSNIMESSNKKSFKKEYQRRKPNSQVNKVYINGNEVEIAYYDGFPIKKEDAERLRDLKKQMISRGLPRSEIAKAMKLERRKAEKALAREKKKVCFNCRSSGHTLSECPSLKNGSDAQLTETGICFKCGSTEHTHFECKVTRGDNFKFAQCFICKEQGHIARQCPDNNRGLYPKGGACRVCGDVTHLKKDCPKYQSEQEENKLVADTIDNQNVESLDNQPVNVNRKSKNFQKVVNF